MSLIEELREEVSGCRRCPELVKNRSQVVFGDGNPFSRVLMIGEAPGVEEDQQGIPFVGRAGRFLTEELAKIGIDRKKYYITNVLKCRPPENRDPTAEEIANCAGFLGAQLALIKPLIIVLLGRYGLQELVKKTFKISEVHGKPIRGNGVIFFPMYHPAAALRDPRVKEAFILDIKRFRKLLEREGIL